MKYYPRKILPDLVEWIDKIPIIVIMGGRQVGKTVLMRLLSEELKISGINDEQVVYLDLEDFRNLDICSQDIDFFKKHLKLQGVDLSRKSYVFIDEIQYHPNPTNFMKLIADHEENIQLIVSGSSTLDIRRKFKDALTGRKMLFHLQPLDFEEFLIFKDEKNVLDWYKSNCFINKKQSFDFIGFRILKEKLVQLANEFIIYGGYPGVVNTNEEKNKIKLLQEIVQTYIRKDIKDFTQIEDVSAFNRLLMLLAGRVASLLNLNELSKEARISRKTIEKYIFLLENTFIIKLLTPFFKNINLEVVKMPKLYFLDTGIINSLVRNFNPLDFRSDRGALVENFVFKQLYSNLQIMDQFNFWRNKNKNEVDFILNGNPVEVKFQNFNSPNIPRGLKQFVKQYQPYKTIIVTKDYLYEDDKLLFIPYFMV